MKNMSFGLLKVHTPQKKTLMEVFRTWNAEWSIQILEKFAQKLMKMGNIFEFCD